MCRLIAEELGVAASKARVVSGAKSRVKQVAVTGEPAELLARLERATPVSNGERTKPGR